MAHQQGAPSKDNPVIKLKVRAFLMLLLTAGAIRAEPGNNRMAEKYAEGGDYVAAEKLWIIEAEKGDAVAQANLGILYEDGQRGVSRDCVFRSSRGASRCKPRGISDQAEGLRSVATLSCS